jgi:serine/threonine protein kinase
MTPKERYLKIKEIFLAVSHLPQTKQKQYLQLTCQEYPTLITDVEAMLKAEEAKEPLFRELQEQAENLAKSLIFEDLLEQQTNLEEKIQLEENKIQEPKVEKSDLALNSYLTAKDLIDERYKIESELGRGGFAIVYLAKDLRLNEREVVIKVLNEEMIDFSWALQKFLKEISALAKLNHPNVISIYDSGVLTNGRPFFVMEYIKGNTLRKLLYGANSGLNPSRVANIITQLGKALSNVHRENIYHRDLKPENILVHLVNGQEHIKVIDFGIATVKESSSVSTLTNTITGTPIYIAPEQLEGKPSASSDIYAMGVIAYELLTGRPPFNIYHFPASLTISKLKELHKMPIVPPSLLSPHLSKNVDKIILKALALDPHYRYSKASFFAEELFQELEKKQPQINFEINTVMPKTLEKQAFASYINNSTIVELESLFSFAIKTKQIRLIDSSERESIKMHGFSSLKESQEQIFEQKSKLSLAINLKCNGHLLLFLQENESIFLLVPSLFTGNTYLRSNLLLLPTQGLMYEDLQIAEKIGKKSILAIITEEPIKIDLPKPTIKAPAPKLEVNTITKIFSQLEVLEESKKKAFWTPFFIVEKL